MVGRKLLNGVDGVERVDGYRIMILDSERAGYSSDSEEM